MKGLSPPLGAARLSWSLTASFTLTSIVGGDTIVVNPIKDNSIFNNGNSNGAGDAVFVGQTGTGIVQRGLIDFRVAGVLPTGSTILSASLELELIQISPFGEQEVLSLHRVSKEWGEGMSVAGGGTGAPPTTDDATWTHTFFPDQFWTAPGGDFEATVSASQTVGTALGTYVWGSSPQLVADVEAWLDDPAAAHGWLIMGNEADLFTARKFASSENLNAASQPKLIIEFEPPPCPWDCGNDDQLVGVNDFLSLLAQWDMVGTSCDLGLGEQGVGIQEFLAVLANWGPCP